MQKKPFSVHVRLYTRFLLTYLLVFALLSLIFIQAQFRANSMLRKEAVLSAQDALARICIQVDQQISSAEYQAYSLQNRVEIKAVSNLIYPYRPKDYYTLRLAGDTMKNYIVQAEYVKEALLLFGPEHVQLFSAQAVVTDVDFHYNTGVFGYLNASSGAFKELFFARRDGEFFLPTQSIMLLGRVNTMATYARPLFNARQDIQCYYVLLMDFSNAVSELEASNMENSRLIISDNTQQVIYTYGEERISRLGGMEASYTSELNGLTYTVQIPDDYVYAKLMPFSDMFRMFMLVFLVIGIFMSFLCAYYSSSSLRNLVKSIGRYSNSERVSSKNNVFTYLQNSVEMMQADYNSMNDRVRKLSPLAHYALIDRMLNGHAGSFGGIQNMQEQGMLDSFPSCFRVAFLGTVTDNEPVPAGVWSQITGALSPYVLHPVNSNSAALILNTQSWAQDTREAYHANTEKRLERVLNEIYEKTGLWFSVGIGREYFQIPDVSISYHEAMRAFRNAALMTNQVIWYSEVMREGTPYEFPYELLDRLGNLLLSGDGSTAVEQLDRQLDRMDVAGLDRYKLEQCYYELRGMLLRVENEMGELFCVAEVPAVNAIDSLCALREHMASQFLQIASHVQADKRTSANRVAEQMNEFVHGNYHNSQLSLQMLSDHFNMSPKYVSLFFKEKNGVNFSDYLERVRLDKAAALLVQNCSTQIILEKTGYASANSFYRAFKRKYGLTPGAWASKDKTDRRD